MVTAEQNHCEIPVITGFSTYHLVHFVLRDPPVRPEPARHEDTRARHEFIELAHLAPSSLAGHRPPLLFVPADGDAAG